MSDEQPLEPWVEDEETVSTSVDVARLRQRSSGFKLRQMDGPGAPQDFPLTGARYVVGRSSEVSVSVPSSLLSREHMAVERGESEYRAIDLDSRNGIFLNGIRIHSAILRHGDVVQLGDVVFEYHEAF